MSTKGPDTPIEVALEEIASSDKAMIEMVKLRLQRIEESHATWTGILEKLLPQEALDAEVASASAAEPSVRTTAPKPKKSTRKRQRERSSAQRDTNAQPNGKGVTIHVLEFLSEHMDTYYTARQIVDGVNAKYPNEQPLKDTTSVYSPLNTWEKNNVVELDERDGQKFWRISSVSPMTWTARIGADEKWYVEAKPKEGTRTNQVDAAAMI